MQTKIKHRRASEHDNGRLWRAVYVDKTLSIVAGNDYTAAKRNACQCTLKRLESLVLVTEAYADRASHEHVHAFGRPA